MKREDTTPNIVSINEEDINHLERCVKELKFAQTKVDKSGYEIAVKIKSLCSDWVGICAELIEVSVFKPLSIIAPTNLVSFVDLTIGVLS